MRRKFLLIFLLSIITIAIFAAKIYTQEATNGLNITPYSLELTVNPGQTVSRTMTLTNFTEETVDITVDKRNFTANGEEGQVALTDEETGFSLASWIKSDPAKATLKPREKQEFTITINIPANAEPGGHFGSVVFATVPPKNVNQTGAALSQEVAGLILVKIPGDITENARVESFVTESNFYEMGPAKFNVRVKNESNVHIKPFGQIVVRDMFGKSYTVPVEGRNVLPNAVRKLEGTLPNRFLIGKYDADLRLSYGSEGGYLTAATSFWAFPIKTGAIVLVIIVILFMMRKRLLKAFKAILTGK